LQLNPLRALQKIDLDPAWLSRIFTIIPVVLILLAGTGVLWVYFFVLSLLPENQSIVETPGIIADVRVVRDPSGIPGIIGEREEDVVLVLGYVMAEDRLWQMDYLRRAGQGRLAEILGSDYLDRDYIVRMVTAGRPREQAANLGPRERLWLEKFVEGVNRYITDQGSKLPVEFSLLEYRPELFSADDVFAILHGLVWESSPAPKLDAVLTKILGKLGKEKALPLFPSDPAASVPFVASELIGWEPKGPLLSTQTLKTAVPALYGGIGWVLGKQNTRSGKPIVGSAIYQGIAAPGFWYRARISTQDFNLTGVFIPGVPAAIAGTNGKLTWSCIPAASDDSDLFIEKLDDSQQQYWRIDRWKRIEETVEHFRIKGGDQESRRIALTETGPIVSEIHKSCALSLRWTGRDGTSLFPCIFALNRARNEKDIASAAAHLVAPCMYVLWADEQENCGIRWAGAVPVRAPGSDGIVPLPAWTAVHDWSGYFSPSEMPAVTNPKGGLSIVSEGRPGGQHFPLFVTCYWSDDGRRARIEEILNKSADHSREGLQSTFGDTVSPVARGFTPPILNAVAQKGSADPAEKEAARVLASWDFRMNRDSAGAAIFGLTWQSMMEEILMPLLGEDLFNAYVAHHALPDRLIRSLLLAQDKKLPGQKTVDELFSASFRKAVGHGKDLMGPKLAEWRWGEIHKIQFHHPIAVRSRFLEALYDVGPMGVSGSFDTIAQSGWSHARPFYVQDSISLSQITDMTQPPGLFCLTHMGASAHFFSSHYKDQISAWLAGRYFREPTDATDIRKSGFDPVVFKSKSSRALSLN
jgi:penicillin amidase